ncbi:peptide-methionine (S)-S-oxide reductase MsrA [Leptolyngbya iicbica]|uniref:Peptide methionine sulfoxide reductase MsrA n=2 Tax=Cyanophyceae TaxID=3028117 RepID=A0A4Q7EAI8_9CYAN|nr:peptide-methionine (S)-S-oxide reductase MsrA [Leptolyngbya sp. LK]RZM78005.1 peptide-methionine (S)-S-oxide reductase [Leptolyngbya sp. LK]
MTRSWLRLIAGILSLTLAFASPGWAANGAIASANSASAVNGAETATAIFAGGCFWCMEKPFDELPGVISTTSGYTGGTVANPSYMQVSGGGTGHVEAVKVAYDPAQISYDQLLEVFWHNVDPVDSRGQFCDKGSQYRSVIFYADEQQAAAAETSKQALAATQFDQAIATEILAASTFYPAEDYHQNYYQTHPVRYKVYRYACGRDQRLEAIWGEAAGESTESAAS